MNAENDYIRAGQRGSLDDSPNAGKAKRSKSMGDLDSKEIEMLSEFVTLSLKIGYTYIQEGICDFQQWSKAMKDGFVANTSLFTVLNLTNAEVDKFIEDTWNSPFTMDGETKLLKEWAFVQKIGRKSDTQCIKENDISSNQKITDISIPRDENGEYLFTQVPAEQTYAYLNAQEDLTPKEVEMLVSLNIQEAQKRMKELEDKRPKPTPKLNEYLANKAKWESENRQAQAIFDYWNLVKAIGESKKIRCYYDVLGVSRKATMTEIKEAFKTISQHIYKDGRTKDNKHLMTIYSVLSNYKSRAEYDKWLLEQERGFKIFDVKRSDVFAEVLREVDKLLRYHSPNSTLSWSILYKAITEKRYYSSLKFPENKKKLALQVIKAAVSDYVQEGGKADDAMELLSRCSKDVEKSLMEINKSENASFEKKAIWLLAFLLIFFIALALSLLLRQKSAEKSGENQQVLTEVDSTEEVIGYETVDSVATETIDADYGYMNSSQSNVGNRYVESVLNIDPSSYRGNSAASASHSTARGSNRGQASEGYEETYLRNGDVPYASYFGKGEYDARSLSELKIINKSSTDAVVLLYASTDDVIRNVFVSRGSTYTMKKIPEYQCIVKVMYGNSWNARKDNGDSFPEGGFMENVSFSKTLWTDAFSFLAEQTSDGISYPSYSITLHKVVNGNLGSKETSKADFFE